VGIESTVVSLVGERPVLLRPGALVIEGLEPPAATANGAHLSPGMHPKHYAPRTRLVLGEPPPHGHGHVLALPANPRAAAAELYATLHRLDHMRYDWIAVALPPNTPEWAGVRDRLQRAAS
jgi:L-threonylcarbamoyladenylate synthase